MKHLILAFIVLAVASLAAETIVPAGPVQGTWDQAGSPYRVMGHLSIASGTSLLVNEGVEVIFEGTFKIDVAGRLLATGTSAHPISFTAQDTLNGWSGIRFLNSGGMGNLPSGFTHTQFSYGKAIWGGGATDPLNYGGAVWASNAGTLSFDNCLFIRCKSGQDGSAVYAKDGTTLLMQDCMIKSCENGFFGGVFVKDGSTVISGCSFEANSAVTFAAALYFYNCSEAKVISCKFIDNVSGAVTGIYSYDSPLKVINSLFAGNNTTMGLGGGIGAIFGTLTVTNCSFADNGSAQGGAAIWINSLDSNAQITNSIFWNNVPNAIASTSSSYVLSYCSTQSEEGDESNIFGDPLFVNPALGDFSLTATSPCIDAGTPDITGLMLPDLDLGGMDRVVDGNADSIARIDIGCYEWQLPLVNGILEGIVTDMESTPINGATVTVNGQTVQTDESGSFSMELAAGIYTLNCSATGYEDYMMENIQITAGQTTNLSIQMTLIVSNDDELAPLVPTLQAWPNPFSSQTALRWNTKGPSTLEIFNLRGQLVTSHLIQNPDTDSWTWNGLDRHGRQLPSGVYLCRMSSADVSVTMKVLLRK